MGPTGTDDPTSLSSSPPPTGPLYLDSNATTPILPEVLQAMQPFLADIFGNPSSAHQHGRRARKALADAREKAAAPFTAMRPRQPARCRCGFTNSASPPSASALTSFMAPEESAR